MAKPDACGDCEETLYEEWRISSNFDKERELLGYGKKSWLFQAVLVVEAAVKRRWRWIFGKGGKK